MKILLVLLALLTPRMVDAGCSFSTIQPVTFTAYDPLAVLPYDGTGFFNYKCTVGTLAITIDLDFGVRGNRTMVGTKSGNTDTLAYTLYLDATRLLTWGNTALTHMIVATPPTSFTPVTVYGRLAAKQNVLVDSYNDTMTITINY